jgi:predicted tellurium resistance membrane protein TerC
MIILADLIMSTDNILAVAGASSEGNFFLLLFGLGLSIPIVVVGAVFVAMLMSRFGWQVFLGAAVVDQ